VRALQPLGIRRTVILRWTGPLRDQFASEADQLRLEPWRRARVALRTWTRTRPAAVWLEQLAAAWVLARHRPSVVWLNTVKSACYVRPALRLGRPVVLHVHELEPLASQTLARYRLDGRLARVRLVACSEGVRSNLARLAGVDPAAITVIPSTVDAAAVQARAGAEARPPADAAAMVVGACGTADHRKGADLWLAMAARVRAARGESPVRFRWIGQPALPALDQQVRTLGLEGTVGFTGALQNPYPSIAAVDVFVHAARSDPFPLAVLEAMALGRPVVAFAVDGVRDQVGDAGVLVPPGDVDALARAVVDLLGDQRRREELGALARARVTQVYGIDAFADAVRAEVQAALRH
jgi:glycosyltransferase involved in cell wall biosynthesis